MKVLLQAATVCVLRSVWEGDAWVGRLSFVSRLRQYLFSNMLDRGSFDFSVIGGRGRGEEDPAGLDGTESWAGGVKLYLATAMLRGAVVLVEQTLSAIIYSRDVLIK